MRIIHLALKDLQQIVRDRRSLLFLIIMPVIFTFFFGMMYTKPAISGDTRLKIGVLNQDGQGILGQTLVAMMNQSDTVQAVILKDQTAAQIDASILKGDLAAGLVIPQGFSQGTLLGQNPKLEMVLNAETNDGQTVRRALQTIITRTLGAAQTARSSADAYAAAGDNFVDDAARLSYLEDAVARTAARWEKAPLVIKTTSAVTQSKDPLAANPYLQFSPGLMVQFAIFGLVQAAMVMVLERKNGAMARLLTTPMTRVELIGGHVLGMFLVFFFQQLLLVLFGQFVLKVNYFQAPLATLLVMVALSLFVSALGLLISTLVRREDQVILWAMIAMFLFSALGGSWFSLEMVGKTFATIGHLTPTAWAIDGFQNVVVRGLGVESVLLPVTIILAYALACFGISIWRFKFE
jgi:ABC-2 type transport system permease protein